MSYYNYSYSFNIVYPLSNDKQILYSFVQFATLPALIAAAVALGENNSDNSPLPEGSGGGIPDVVTQSEVNGAAGFVVAITSLAMLIEVLAIIIRICNIGLINIKFKIVVAIVSMHDKLHG